MGGHRRPRVFIDAGIIYSKTLRDWLGHFYLTEVTTEPLFDVYWSDDVLAEAMSSLRDDHPSWPGGRIARIRELISQQFEVGYVRDFSVEDSNYLGPDPGDAHVHAAAVACSADYLLTTNDRDFRLSSDEADSLPYEVLTADEFFTTFTLENLEIVDACMDKQIAFRIGRGEDPKLSEALEKAGCPEFAKLILTRLQVRALTGR